MHNTVTVNAYSVDTVLSRVSLHDYHGTPSDNNKYNLKLRKQHHHHADFNPVGVMNICIQEGEPQHQT